MSNLMDIISQREICGFMSEKHVKGILSRRELINGCSVDKPYVQDGQVFTLKLENGLVMTISKDLIKSLREVIRNKPNFLVLGRRIDGRYHCNCNDVNIDQLVSWTESNDKSSFFLILQGQDEPFTVSKQLIKSLSDMIDPGPCLVRKLCTYLSNFIRRAFFGIF